MKILFLQTAEATYRPLLEATSRTVVEYCSRHQCSYESHFGIIRGYHPWHATYNRIALLKRLVDTGFSGWVCYLDADAYIADLDFDLKTYLRDQGDIALIIAPGGPTGRWWDVNAGVFLINLAHPVGQAIVREWSRLFDEITDEQLRTETGWSQVTDDQVLLHELLTNIPDAEQSTLVDKEHPRLLNYGDGRFIKQVLRGESSLERRVAHLRMETNKLLGNAVQTPENTPNSDESQTRTTFVHALYRMLLLREPEPDGLIYGVTLMQAGMGFEEMMLSFLKSSEFAAKHRQFIDTYVSGDPEWK